MGFSSALMPGEVIIDDSNYSRLCLTPESRTFDNEVKLFGRIPRDFDRVPHGALPGARPFDVPLIPRSEWQARVQEMEESKTRLSDLALMLGIKSLDQNGTNYCWCNAVVGCVQMVRAKMGQLYVPLSPASAAAQIKNYSNEGGWGGEALDWITKHGVASAKVWPPNAISRQYKTAESDADAMNHVVTEWLDLQSRNFDQLYTLLLLRVPVAIGLNWWSHEVMAMDPMWVNGVPMVRFRNSWGDSYGSQGFNTLSESKATPDDACAPEVAMAA